MRQSVVPALTVFLILLTAGIIPLQAAAMAKPMNIGDPAPVCILTGLDGKQVSLPEEGKGRAVIIHFWSSDCRICQKEMPVLEALYQRYKGQNVVIYAITRQSASAVKSFAERMNITFPVILDGDGTIAKQFGAIGVPRTFFIDRNGLLKKKLPGAASANMLEKFIQNIL